MEVKLDGVLNLTFGHRFCAPKLIGKCIKVKKNGNVTLKSFNGVY